MNAELKWKRILRFMAEGGRLTRFDAEKLGDHCLNSTVAEIDGRGVSVSREPIVLEGRYGAIRCKRYWIEPTERERAKRLLESVTRA